MNSPAGRNRYTREQFIAFLAAWLRQQPDLTLQAARAEGMKSGFTVGRREFDEARKLSLSPPAVPGEAAATPPEEAPRAGSPQRDDRFGTGADDDAEEPVAPPAAASAPRTPAAPPVETPLPPYPSARHVPTPPDATPAADRPAYPTRAPGYDRPAASSYDRPASYDRPTSYDRPSSYDRPTPTDRPGARHEGPRRFATSFDDALRDVSTGDAQPGWASRSAAPTPAPSAPAPTPRPAAATPPVAPKVTPPVVAPARPAAPSTPTPPPAAKPADASWLVGTVSKKPEASFAEIRAAAVAAGHTAPSPIAFARARRSAAAAAARENDAARTPRRAAKGASPAPHTPAEVVAEIRRVSEERARLLEALKRIAKLVDRQGF